MRFKRLRPVVLGFFLIATTATSGQVPDSLFFNLYTDSLKIGTFNYINVVGQFKTGFQPMTEKELIFLADTGRFFGNSLFIDSNFKGDRVRITVSLRADTSKKKELILFVKTQESTVPLLREEDLFKNPRPSRRNRRSEKN